MAEDPELIPKSLRLQLEDKNTQVAHLRKVQASIEFVIEGWEAFGKNQNKKARGYFVKATEQKTPESHRQYARFLTLMGEYDEANQQLVDHENLINSLLVENILNQGENLLKVGRLAESEEQIERARAVAEKADDELLKLKVQDQYSLLLRKKGKYEEAIELLIQSIPKIILSEKEPSQVGQSLADSFNNFGNALMHQSKFEEARNSYEKALYFGKSKRELRATVNENIGGTYLHEGKYPDAEKYFLIALEEEKITPRPLVLANLYVNLWQLCIVWDQKEEKDVFHYFDLARSIYQEHDHDQGLENIQKLTDFNYRQRSKRKKE